MHILQGRVALVTGAGRGIGRGAALQLARWGASVALLARSTDQLQAVSDEVRAIGVQAIALSVDVADAAAVATAVARIEAELGPVDILVNNAGMVGPIDAFERVVADDWARVIQVNVLGAYFVMRAVVPGMIERGYGRILNLSSGAADPPGIPRLQAYSTSKAALDALSLGSDAELFERGVHVLAIRPGVVDTEMVRGVAATPVEQAGETTYQLFQSVYQNDVVTEPEAVGAMIAAAALSELHGQVVDVRQMGDQLQDILAKNRS